MNLRLFQELMDLNLVFERVIHGLRRLEKVRLFNSEIIRYARADVERARVDANREFFDNFDDIVENDAVWAYKFQRDYHRKIKDPDDIYLEIKDAEERRKKKDCLRAWQSCPVGTCQTKSVTTRSKPESGSVLGTGVRKQ
jgi:hypothetical protein